MDAVNAKNAFGGYVGYEYYRYSRGHGVALDASDPDLDALHEACLDSIEDETARIKGQTPD